MSNFSMERYVTVFCVFVTCISYIQIVKGLTTSTPNTTTIASIVSSDLSTSGAAGLPENNTSTPVDCGKKTIENGNVIHNSTTYMSKIYFICNEGFHLDGINSSFCLANGTWSDMQTKCVLIGNLTTTTTPSETTSTTTSSTIQTSTTFQPTSTIDTSILNKTTTPTVDTTTPGLTTTSTVHTTTPNITTSTVDTTTLSIETTPTADTTTLNITLSIDDTTTQSIAKTSTVDTTTQSTATTSTVDTTTQSTATTSTVDTTTQSTATTSTVDTTIINLATNSSIDITSNITTTSSVDTTTTTNIGTISTADTTSSIATIDMSSTTIATTTELIDCGNFSIEFGEVINLNENTTFMSEIFFVCDEGYHFEGLNASTCLANSTWNNTDVKCEINGNNTVQSSTFHSTTFTVPSTTSSVTTTTLTSTSSLTTSIETTPIIATTTDSIENIITTVTLDCGPPMLDITNGELSFNSTILGSTATVICHTGYRLNGTKMFRCSAAQWIPDFNQSKCQIIDCGLPPNISNAAYSSFLKTTYDSTAVYTCSQGYKLHGQHFPRCLSNGSWSGTNVACVPIVCADTPQSFTNGNYHNEKTKMTFNCIEGYSLNGFQSLTCLPTGHWSAAFPTCEKVEVAVQKCPADTDNRGTDWQETPPGQTAVKICKEKGTSGSISRNCTKDGVWKLPRYNCVKKEIEEADTALNVLNSQNVTETDKVETITSVLSKLVQSTNTSTADETKSDSLYDGEIEKVTSILEKVASISQTINITEEQTNDFLDTTSNLLKPVNSESFQSLEENDDYSAKKGTGGAGKVLKVVGQFAKSIAKSLDSTNGTKTVEKDNLLLTVAKIKADNDLHFPDTKSNKINSSTSVQISKDSLQSVKSYSGILYQNLSGLLPPRIVVDGVFAPGFEINGAVVDMQLLNADLEGKSSDVDITLNFQNFKTGEYKPKCTYWNFNASLWDTSGCRLVPEKTNSSITVCKCDHLTNFAILMNPSSTPNLKAKALDYISIIGCSISCVSLVITVAMHITLWRYMKSDRAKILMNLSVALILSYAIFLAGVDRTENSVACTTVAVALHYINLVVFFLMLSTLRRKQRVFFLMLSEGIEILITVIFVFAMKSRLRYLLAMSWGVPILIVGISVGVTKAEGYGSKDFCWLSVKSGLIWAFVGPALFIIIANFVQLFIVIRAMFKVQSLKDKSKVEKVRTGVRCLCVLLPLTGGTWVIGVFYVNETMAWIQYLFAILNSLQGVFIMFFHCIINSQMKIAIAKKRKKYQASSSFTKSSGKTISIPRPSSTSGLFKGMYESSESFDDIRHYGAYNMVPRQDSNRQRWRYSSSNL